MGVAEACKSGKQLKAGLEANKSGLGFDISMKGVDTLEGVQGGVLDLPHWVLDTDSF